MQRILSSIDLASMAPKQNPALNSAAPDKLKFCFPSRGKQAAYSSPVVLGGRKAPCRNVGAGVLSTNQQQRDPLPIRSIS